MILKTQSFSYIKINVLLKGENNSSSYLAIFKMFQAVGDCGKFEPLIIKFIRKSSKAASLIGSALPTCYHNKTFLV